MRLQNKNIAQIGHGREIADHAGKANLLAATIINSKAQGMLDGSRHDLARDALGPIAIGQEAVDDIEIEARGIGGDEEFAAALLDDGGCGSFQNAPRRNEAS